MTAETPVEGWGPDDAGLPPDHFLSEMAYLVSRGVRPMALVGHCARDPLVMLRARTRLDRSASGFDVLTFVIERDGDADCGYAACKWVIDLYEAAWLGMNQHRHEITGLLLGYSPEAIARHMEQRTGSRFTMPDIHVTAPRRDVP